MMAKIRSNLHMILLIGIPILNGCAVERPVTVIQSDGFPRPAAREVIAAGFENITERYIEAIAPEDFALEGLRGVVKASYVNVQGRWFLNFDGFAPATAWEELSTTALEQSL